MKKNLFEKDLPRKILGFLLKNPMSQTDLARAIYKNPNSRDGIHRWINRFLDAKLVQKKEINSKSVLYFVDLRILGKFNKREETFIRIIIERFWSPLHSDSINNLKDVLLRSLVIKKAYAIDKKLFDYNANRDLKFYEENKGRFWKDKKFRNEFLDKIKDKERRIKQKVPEKDRLYLFCSLIAPDNLFDKIEGNHLKRSNPLFTAINILKDLKNSKV